MTDDITDVLPDDIPIAELSKKHLITLLHYRTDRSREDVAELVGCDPSYVSGVVSDLSDTQQPELVGTLRECREHELVRYVKCVECGAVFDLDALGYGRRPKYRNEQEPAMHVDWFQHTRFEGYVVKPVGAEPPTRSDGAVIGRHEVEA